MIMGMDLMTSIGIKVDCEQRYIRWGGTEIPLKNRSTLKNDDILHCSLYFFLGVSSQ
jgi:hypothetical protein